MSFLAFILIVVSAVLHATWNLIAKKNTMTVPFYAIIVTVGMLTWFHVQFWTPVKYSELPWQYWAYGYTSVLCDSVLYCIGLVLTYRTMDMASAYPMMRALPILFTALMTAILGWGAKIGPVACFGFLLVFIGAMLMPLKSITELKWKNYWNPNMLHVIMTALGTTGYTIFDSKAQQVMSACSQGIPKPVVSLSYYSCRGIMLASTLWIMTLCVKTYRQQAANYWKKKNFLPALSGVCASATYVLVLIAMNYVTNVSYVQVFRQLGLPIGMLGGVIFLKEKAAPVKWVGIILIVAGLAISLYR